MPFRARSLAVYIHGHALQPLEMAAEPPCCPICLEAVANTDMFRTHCATAEHVFHLTCIHEYAKFKLKDAVVVQGGRVSVRHEKLPTCPTCRADLTWASRSTAVTAFFLLGAGQNLVELGTVRENAKRPRLDICNRSYAKRTALAR